MAYYQNYNNSGAPSFGGYQQNVRSPYGGYQSRAPRRQYQTTATYKKHSGAKYGIGSNNAPYISAWNYSRRHGLVKVFCRPYKGTSVHTSKSGKEWHNWFVTVTAGYSVRNLSGLYDPVTQRVIIKELGMVVNPKARNNGYCGTFTKRN